jgi:hypothetical protein
MCDQQYKEAYAAKLPYIPTLEQMLAAPQQMAALSFMQSCSMVAAAVDSSTAATLFKDGTTAAVTVTGAADSAVAADATDDSITEAYAGLLIIAVALYAICFIIVRCFNMVV